MSVKNTYRNLETESLRSFFWLVCCQFWFRLRAAISMHINVAIALDNVSVYNEQVLKNAQILASHL